MNRYIFRFLLRLPTKLATTLVLIYFLGFTYASESPEVMRSPVNQVFQYKVEVTETGWEKGKEKKTITYLWIPENTKKVRGLLVLCRNAPEHILVGHEKIRELCRKHNFAIFWGVGSFYNFFSKEDGKIANLAEKITHKLAAKSGYPEIASAPWIPIGESGHQLMVRALMKQKSSRTLAGIGLKDPVIIANNDLTIPSLSIHGTAHEWGQTKKNFHEIWNGKEHGELLSYKKYIETSNKNRNWPSSLVLDPESGHFCLSERLVDYIADWLDAVIPLRLNSDGSLKDIDFSKTYRADLPYLNRPDKEAFLANQDGEGFWYPNIALAEKAQAIARVNWNAKSQLAGVANKDGDKFWFTFGGIPWVNVARPSKKHPNAPFVSFEDDGVTFEFKPVLYDSFPKFWKQEGESLVKAPGTPTIEWLCGAVEPLGNNKFRFAMDRTWPSALYFTVRHKGTKDIRGVSTPFQMDRGGEAKTIIGQVINFEQIADVKVGTKELELKASSNRGLPVRFYVDSGPAIIKGNKLIFTGIPPKSNFPIYVEIVAWQWGTSKGEGVLRAQNVHRTFRILSPEQFAKLPRPKEMNVDKSDFVLDDALLWLSAGEKVVVLEDKLVHWQDKTSNGIKLVPNGQVNWSAKGFNGKPSIRLSGKKTSLLTQLPKGISGPVSVLVVAATPKAQAFTAHDGVNNRIVAMSADGKADYEGGMTIGVGKNKAESPRLIIAQKEINEPMVDLVLGAMATQSGNAGNFNATMDLAEVIIVPKASETKAKAYLEKKYNLSTK